jgi:hypothetical protein
MLAWRCESSADPWRKASKEMAAGEEPAEFRIGTPGAWPELAPLLASRARLLGEWATADDMWSSRLPNEELKLTATLSSLVELVIADRLSLTPARQAAHTVIAPQRACMTMATVRTRWQRLS